MCGFGILKKSEKYFTADAVSCATRMASILYKVLLRHSQKYAIWNLA